MLRGAVFAQIGLAVGKFICYLLASTQPDPNTLPRSLNQVAVGWLQLLYYLRSAHSSLVEALPRIVDGVE